MNDETDRDLRSIAYAMDEVYSVEILWSAFVYIKQNPDATITQAIVYGTNEWNK